MADNIEVISESNLSVAWARAFIRLMAVAGGEISPLIVTVDCTRDNAISEHIDIRNALDLELVKYGEFSIETVANTIFPQSLWNQKRNRDLLYKRYIKIWPKIRKHIQNRRGTYFQRLIAFNDDTHPVNQLEHILSGWNSGLHRHSALQAAIFDPKRDHVRNRVLGFPCLHQVAFTPGSIGGKKGLFVTGFYATQHIFEKAYGNYLGLCRLGQFMSAEMGLPLLGMNCIAAKGRIGDHTKKSIDGLRQNMLQTLSHIDSLNEST